MQDIVSYYENYREEDRLTTNKEVFSANAAGKGGSMGRGAV